jgi:hypothetical protein
MAIRIEYSQITPVIAPFAPGVVNGVASCKVNLIVQVFAPVSSGVFFGEASCKEGFSTTYPVQFRAIIRV